MTDYRVFRALSVEQYFAIVDDGTEPGRASPLRTPESYAALVGMCEPVPVDPRLPLAFAWAEGHMGSDPGLAAMPVNNFLGVKFVGQDGATDSGIAADTGGTYAGFADLAACWREWLRIMRNSIIGPAFASGDLVGVVEHYTNGPGTGHNKIDQYERYVATWPPASEPPAGAPVVTPDDVVRVALADVGKARLTDSWNGEHPVSMWCQADIEDWLVAAGLPVVHYPSAAVAGDAAPLAAGRAPKGALVYFRGPGWSVDDHGGISLGDGRTISGLATVVVTDGWQDLPSYRGWRWPDGIALAPAVDVDYFADGNPWGPVPMRHPFWSRWDLLNRQGLALPQMGWPLKPERTLPNGRRVQEFERGSYGTQAAPDPWDVVQLLPSEVAAL